MKKIQPLKLIICIAIPLGVGFAASLLTRGSMETFAALNKPPLSPPAWLFPVVWTILYVLMGIASYFIVTSEKPNRYALTIYAIQLGFNFIWSGIFFNLSLYFVAFVWLVLLWLLILETMVLFRQISNIAGYLMLPYLIWVTFAGYLNCGIWLLQR